VRITAVRVDHLSTDLDPPFRAAWDPVPRRAAEAVLVRVETDEGVVGIGSGDSMAGLAGREHLFVGTDPLQVQRHVRTIESINFHGGRCWPLEVALWDVVGQVAGLPVATLFGGALDRVPAYASCGAALPAAERAESALALREEGFRALKLRIDRTRPEEGLAAVAAVREAVGADMDIMVDLNQSWRMAGDTGRPLDVAAVRRIVDRLAELDVFWVEEPLPYADRSGLGALRAATGVRIAGGEMLDSVDAVLAHLDDDLLDVYQTDVVLALGMSRARTLGELALLRNRSFTPHTWTNGIGLLANLHVVAGIGGGPYLEFPHDPPGWTPERRDFMLAEPVRIDSDGCVPVPTLPGIGAVLAPGVAPP
jgi:D-galactarolactone cycloisomerase